MRALKEVLWDALQRQAQEASPADAEASTAGSAPALSFQSIVSAIKVNNPAGQLQDISVHLCFICMLHLANEHGLKITGVPSLDSLAVSC